MARHPNLMQRKGVWYFRRRVPSDLVDVIGSKFITKSLGTRDHRAAVDQLRVLQGDVQTILDEARAKQTNRFHPGLGGKTSSVPALAPARLEALVQEWAQAQRNDRFPADNSVKDRVLVEDLMNELTDEEARLKSPITEDHEALVGIVTKEILGRGGIATTHAHGSIRLFAKNDGASELRLEKRDHEHLYQLVRRALIELSEVRQRQLRGEILQTYSAAPTTVVASTSHYTLSDLLEDFRRDPGRGARTDKTELDYGMVFRLLIEVIGPTRPIDKISRDHCKEIRDLLLKLPRDATKKFPGKPFRDVVASSPDQVRLLKSTTINSHLTKISTIFNWAVREGKLQQSPARGLVIKEEGGHEEEGRRSFTISEMRRFTPAVSMMREILESRARTSQDALAFGCL